MLATKHIIDTQRSKIVILASELRPRRHVCVVGVVHLHGTL